MTYVVADKSIEAVLLLQYTQRMREKESILWATDVTADSRKLRLWLFPYPLSSSLPPSDISALSDVTDCLQS